LAVALVLPDVLSDPAQVAGAMLVVSIVLVAALFEKAVASNTLAPVPRRLSPLLNLSVVLLGVAWIAFATVLLGRGLAPV
jgi:hypothetical protein